MNSACIRYFFCFKVYKSDCSTLRKKNFFYIYLQNQMKNDLIKILMNEMFLRKYKSSLLKDFHMWMDCRTSI